MLKNSQCAPVTTGTTEHVISAHCPCDKCRRTFHPTVEEQKDDARKYGSKVACRVEVEYEDGEVWRAEGDDAFQVWKALTGAHQFTLARQGQSYDGPQMKKVDK